MEKNFQVSAKNDIADINGGQFLKKDCILTDENYFSG